MSSTTMCRTPKPAGFVAARAGSVDFIATDTRLATTKWENGHAYPTPTRWPADPVS